MMDNYMYGDIGTIQVEGDGIVGGWEDKPVLNDTVNVPRGRYEELLEAESWLNALNDAGVDNWDGIDFAREIFETFNIK